VPAPEFRAQRLVKRMEDWHDILRDLELALEEV
jgi:hypothetical protein